MTHGTKYVDTLPSAEQIKSLSGNGSHISLLRLLHSGMTVAQEERYIKVEVWERYIQMKAKYINLWDKVFMEVLIVFYYRSYSKIITAI